MADVKAEEDARAIALSRDFALENWGEWNFLPEFFLSVGGYFCDKIKYFFYLKYAIHKTIPSR